VSSCLGSLYVVLINYMCSARKMLASSLPAEIHDIAELFGSRLFQMLVADAFKGVKDQVSHFGLNALVHV
jgi:hypothetical protein